MFIWPTKWPLYVEELFDELQLFPFFDNALLEKIIKINVLLKQEQPAVSKLNDYIQQLEQFKKSMTLQQIMENIETAQNASPQHVPALFN